MKLIEAFLLESDAPPSVPVFFFPGELNAEGGIMSMALVRKVHGEIVLEYSNGMEPSDERLNLSDIHAYFMEHKAIPTLITAKGHLYLEKEIGYSSVEKPEGGDELILSVTINYSERVRQGRSRFDSPDWVPETK